MSDNLPVIDVRNLVRRYGRTDAVDGLNLQEIDQPQRARKSLRELKPEDVPFPTRWPWWSLTSYKESLRKALSRSSN